MAFGPGARLGPYEIQSALGAGGMGEVYKATDTNLKRAVAIKVLPASVAADADRLARFQREAEVLAALNHPHIAAIHGLERSNATTALVMELVDGPTLADRIAEGPVPVDEALPYMSPEQARGKPVDKRTDIWAFGCVLYEMLTGTRAFAGENSQEIIADILKVLPRPAPLPVRSS
jgi:serine/threonine protein kinase